jgi:hypothetical protein
MLGTVFSVFYHKLGEEADMWMTVCSGDCFSVPENTATSKPRHRISVAAQSSRQQHSLVVCLLFGARGRLAELFSEALSSRSQQHCFLDRSF